MKLPLRKFNPDLMVPKDGRIMLVIGRRGSGKSTLVEDLMYKLHHRYDYGLGMSPTQSSITMLRSHIAPGMVFDDGFSKEHFQKMLAISSLLAKRNKLRKGLLVLDDCNADKEAFKSKPMRDAFMNGRHYGCNILWTMHYCMDILPALRMQVDYVIVLKDNIRKNKERLYNNFFGMFEKVDDFIKVMDQCTENNECLVLDNTVPNPDPRKCLFWYKADLNPPPFRIGREAFWKLSEYYKRNQAEDNDDLLKVHIRPGQQTFKEGRSSQAQLVGVANEASTRIDYVEKADEEAEPFNSNGLAAWER